MQIDITKPQKQLMQDVITGIHNSSCFFQNQTKDTLKVIAQAARFEALSQKDKQMKQHLKLIAETAENRIVFKQSNVIFIKTKKTKEIRPSVSN